MHSDEDRAIINKFLCVNRTANNSPPLPLISAIPFLYADADASMSAVRMYVRNFVEC